MMPSIRRLSHGGQSAMVSTSADIPLLRGHRLRSTGLKSRLRQKTRLHDFVVRKVFTPISSARKAKRFWLLVSLHGLLLHSVPAHALQELAGHITVLESTYMPASISLQLDAGNAACPSGKWLRWTNSASAEATYSMMLAALLANKKVRFYIDDNDTTCTGRFFHILKQS